MASAVQALARARHNNPDIRPVIESSWARSLMCGLDPQAVEPIYRDDLRRSAKIVDAVQDVMNRVDHVLDDSSSSVQLTDARGWILQRWATDSQLIRKMDQASVDKGFSFDESSAGTNSAALALETRRPHSVLGAEHFAEQFLENACFGVPIFHPVRRTLLGSLNLSCNFSDFNGFQLPWLQSVVDQVHERMSVDVSARQKRLISEFMAVAHDPRRHVVAISSDMVILSPRASRALSTDDHAVLWGIAGDSLAFEEPRTVHLSKGRAKVSGRAVTIDDELLGAILTLRSAPEPARRDSPQRDEKRRPALMVEGNGQQQSVGNTAEASCRTPASRLSVIVGEPGTGKLHEAKRRSGPDHGLLDARLCGAEMLESVWLDRLRDLLISSPAVVVGHLERLPEKHCGAVADLLTADRCPPVVVTFETHDEDSWTDHPLAPLFPTVINQAPLRQRLDDIPVLVESIARLVQPQRDQPIWSGEVLHALRRMSWHGNLSALQAVVTRVLTEADSDVIRMAHLPEALRIRAARQRRLSDLEQAEAHTIVVALRQVGGNKTTAARHLGIARSTLYRRIRELGLELELELYPQADTPGSRPAGSTPETESAPDALVN